MSYQQLKSEARKNLEGQWPLLVGVTLLVMIVTSVGFNSLRVGGEEGARASIDLISLILSGPVNLGVALLYLELRKTGVARIEPLLEGFRRFIDAFMLHLITMVFIFLWSLLLVVPGIIAAIRYAMAYLIMAEDPAMTPFKALEASKALMAGHKADYALFVLSFIGWGIVSLLTFGLGTLYLLPYFNASKVNFYQAIKGDV